MIASFFLPSVPNLIMNNSFLLSPFLDLDTSFFSFAIPPLHQIDGSFNNDAAEADRRFSPPLPPPIAPQGTEGAITACRKKGGRKRSLRKDRHSKIRTAQGLRDRRMRLSLDVAQEFFDIQDMLGFDKASKTLRWLITAAKPAVEELQLGVGSSSKSGGSSSKSVDDSSTSALESGGKKGCARIFHESDARTAKRTTSCRRQSATIARESRDMARARARERTQKRKLIQSVPLEAVKEDSSCSHDIRSSVLDHLVAEAEEHCSRSPNWPITLFDYNPMSPNGAAVSLFHEQWVDMEIMLQGDVQRHTWEA